MDSRVNSEQRTVNDTISCWLSRVLFFGRWRLKAVKKELGDQNEQHLETDSFSQENIK